MKMVGAFFMSMFEPGLLHLISDSQVEWALGRCQGKPWRAVQSMKAFVQVYWSPLSSL